MKRYIYILGILYISFLHNVNATTQAPDYLIYQADTFPIYSSPLRKYIYDHPDSKRDSIIMTLGLFSTGCWRGYITYWELRNDSLFLKSVKGKETEMSLSVVFNNPEIKNEVFAWWYSGTIYMPYGEPLFYTGYFEPYPQIYEYELVYEIKEGKLISTICYDSRKSKQSKYARQDGTLQEFFKNNINYSGLPPNAKGKVNVIFSEFDIEGKILDPKIIRSEDERLNEEAIRLIKIIPEWDVFIIHGKIQRVMWTIPIIFEPPGQ